jgi:hypothetical protein
MSRQGANKLLKGLLSRSYSTGRYSARAGEEIAAVSNAHRQELGVIDVRITTFTSYYFADVPNWEAYLLQATPMLGPHNACQLWAIVSLFVDTCRVFTMVFLVGIACMIQAASSCAVWQANCPIQITQLFHHSQGLNVPLPSISAHETDMWGRALPRRSPPAS